MEIIIVFSIMTNIYETFEVGRCRLGALQTVLH